LDKIDLNEYDYDLPDERIAQYPVAERDGSKLLVYRNSEISSDSFRNIDKYIQEDSLLVFNNTRVIRARLLFRKKSGSPVEVFCLEPINPAGYEMSFSSRQPVEWKCLVGNLKKWKNEILKLNFLVKGHECTLSAENIGSEKEARRISFAWDNSDLNFSEVLEGAGHIPLPPYIKRNDEENDNIRYQTVYSTVKGSVAAPTAGLHFTGDVLHRLTGKGVKQAELTLHVGAGTFQPVKGADISGHEMHCEHFFVTADTIKTLSENYGRITAVGTTTVRTLESLYWLGVKAYRDPSSVPDHLSVDQWEPYGDRCTVSVKDSLAALCELLAKRKTNIISASTRILIIPGYDFRMINALVTNFHQPRSTLLLLIAAFTGSAWHDIYNYALDNGFRFLSYGDSSLLYRNQKPESI
jgi:S-adenosylmethionine:tRNA ribosyltransferase-isomerase